MENPIFFIVPCKITLREGTINNGQLVSIFLINSIFILENSHTIRMYRNTFFAKGESSLLHGSKVFISLLIFF